MLDHKCKKHHLACSCRERIFEEMILFLYRVRSENLSAVDCERISINIIDRYELYLKETATNDEYIFKKQKA